ncbi:hypothetical protein ACFW9I_36775 [[Kitasatospora] papulosa]|uniref:hypothetical protein n=1 Tax=[Kitasatospora] papulosa TaxID=1464011 RepID=UPI003690C6F7
MPITDADSKRIKDFTIMNLYQNYSKGFTEFDLVNLVYQSDSRLQKSDVVMELNDAGLQIANDINQRFVKDAGSRVDQNGVNQYRVKLNDAGVQYAQMIISNTRLVMAARMHSDAHRGVTATSGNPQTSASPSVLWNQTNQSRAR